MMKILHRSKFSLFKAVVTILLLCCRLTICANWEPTCYSPCSLPLPKPHVHPDVDDCKAAANQLGAEPRSGEAIIITSDSSRVPQGGYLFPHAWTIGTCSIVVSFRPGAIVDYASPRDLRTSALQVTEKCHGWLNRWGGWIVGGRYRRLVVIAIGRREEGLLGNLTVDAASSITNLTDCDATAPVVDGAISVGTS